MTDEEYADIKEQLQRGRERMDRIEASLSDTNSKIDANTKLTQEVLDMVRISKIGGAIIKWLIALGAGAWGWARFFRSM
jgi:5-bromo-4-chloroindolyl phosphate hydrolysis protein